MGGYKSVGGKAFLLVLQSAVLFSAATAHSQSTGYSFLNIPVGAHAQSMGGAYSAQVRDASAIHSNPSALVELTDPQILAYHSEFFSGYKYNYLAYAHPLASRNSAFGFAGGYLSKGSFTGRDAQGNPSSDFSASDRLLTFAYSRRWNQKVSLGMAANWVQSQVGSYTSNGAALDASGSYQWTERTRATGGIYHLGPSASYQDRSFPMPATLAAGVSHRLFNPFTFTSEMRYGMFDQDFSLAFGGEVNVIQTASFRMGYASQIAGAGPSTRSGGINSLAGFGWGIGLNLFARARFNYGFVPMGDLGATHHVDLAWSFK